MAVALDASMMLSWYFEDERGSTNHLLERVGTDRAVVPAHWLAEVTNGVLMGERRNRASPARVPLLAELLDIVGPEVDHEGATQTVERILPLARAHRLTIYDAIYLELAERRALPLATLDQDLAIAARSVGVEVMSV